MDVISFDLETTGLSTKEDRIVELGATIYTLNDGTLSHVADFVQRCQSPVKMTAASIRITGITQESVDSQLLTAKDVLQLFRTFVNKHCKNKRILTGWNILGFDLPVTCLEASRLPEGARNYFMDFGAVVFDAMLAARIVLPTTRMLRNKAGQASYVLGDVHRVVTKQVLLGAHGALADSKAVVDILKEEMTLFMPFLLGTAPNPGQVGARPIEPLLSTVVSIVQEANRKRKNEHTDSTFLNRLAQVASIQRKNLCDIQKPQTSSSSPTAPGASPGESPALPGALPGASPTASPGTSLEWK